MKRAITLLVLLAVAGVACSSAWGHVMECNRVCVGGVEAVLTKGRTVICQCSNDLWIELRYDPVIPR
jgi:hypothetical protein